jgi:hypothetical protein
MRKSLFAILPAGLVVCLGLLSSASAANRFYINNQSVPIAGQGATDVVEIPILADMDQDTYGFSISLEFDQSKLAVTDVRLGSAVEPLNPEYNAFVITPSPGRLVHGVVFDLSNPITKKISAGTGKQLLLLDVEVQATSAGNSVLNLVNVASDPPRLNVMTDGTGDSVAPAPSLGDGTITFTDARPVIQSFLDNSGCEGNSFFVVGQNFDVSGFRVLVCGIEATAQVVGVGGQQATVTAPGCASTGWAEVEVCTDLGCASEPQGFNYEPDCIPQAPVIQSFLNNTGCADDTFIIVGNHFDETGFGVRVCGVEAEFEVIGVGGQQASVTAPACGSEGWAVVEVYNDVGSDDEAQGFEYLGADVCDGGGASFLRGNANDDGTVDISDAVGILNDLFLGVTAQAPCRDALDSDDSGATDITDAVYLLNFLFQGGPPIPPPYPDPGPDPTADSLPDCA